VEDKTRGTARSTDAAVLVDKIRRSILIPVLRVVL